jgi:hypothetical protein
MRNEIPSSGKSDQIRKDEDIPLFLAIILTVIFWIGSLFVGKQTTSKPEDDYSECKKCEGPYNCKDCYVNQNVSERKWLEGENSVHVESYDSYHDKSY